MKITRRQLVVATTAVSSGVAVRALPQPTAPAAANVQQRARDEAQRNAESLAKFSLPITTEPAFQFKA